MAEIVNIQVEPGQFFSPADVSMSSTASKTDRPRQRSGEHHAILNTDGLKGGMLQHQLNPTPPTFQVKHQHRGLHKSKDSLVENPEYEKPKARKARQ